MRRTLRRTLLAALLLTAGGLPAGCGDDGVSVRRADGSPTIGGFPARPVAGGVRIAIPHTQLFEIGTAKLTKPARRQLLAVAFQLRRDYSGRIIRIDDPDAQSVFPPMAAARAVSVQSFLIEDGGLDARNCYIGVVGHTPVAAALRPADTPAGPAGKSKRWWIEIFIYAPRRPD